MVLSKLIEDKEKPFKSQNSLKPNLAVSTYKVQTSIDIQNTHLSLSENSSNKTYDNQALVVE